MNLPYRFSEPAFRFYEPVIATIVKEWPGPVAFCPANYQRSIETFACRLRDAIRSLKEQRWPTTIPMENFLLIEGEIVVAQLAEMVRVGSKNRLKVALPIEGTLPMLSNDIKVEVKDIDSLKLIAFLAHERVLSRPIRLILPSHFSLATIVEEYDIDIEPLEDGSFRLT